ncbi:MAG: M48 family metalloprotease [Synergistaceae bacterium]|nr:M48 family metalloprotease [Synergistaceae bacterium]
MRRTFSYIFLILLFIVLLSDRGIASEKTLTPEKIREKEKKITQNISEQVEKQIPRVKDSALEKQLEETVAKIKPHMGRDLDYEVRVLERDDPHAFSLPSGLTYITTGMLQFLKSEDEIAAVLTRAFVHADLSHWLTQTSRNEKIDFTTMAQAAAATQSGKVAGGLLNSFLNRGVINFYDNELEKETDLKALDVLTNTGYNKVALLTFVERMRVERLKQIYVKGIGIDYQGGSNPLGTIMKAMKFLKIKSNKKKTDPVKTDMIQANTDMEDRLKAILKYFSDNNIEIERKHALNMLTIKITELSGSFNLSIDETEVMSTEKTDASQNIFAEFKGRLDSQLQLEIPPYDIQVMDVLDSKALLISGRPMLYEKDLINGMPDLLHIRGQIIKALTDAKRDNFLTDFYE